MVNERKNNEHFLDVDMHSSLYHGCLHGGCTDRGMPRPAQGIIQSRLLTVCRRHGLRLQILHFDFSQWLDQKLVVQIGTLWCTIHIRTHNIETSINSPVLVWGWIYYEGNNIRYIGLYNPSWYSYQKNGKLRIWAGLGEPAGVLPW